jgi:hypothetical protein
MTNKLLFLALIPLLMLAPTLSYAIGTYVPSGSNFTSYNGDPINSTSMMVWTAKYCSFDNSSHKQIAKDGDPTHTTECIKTYNTAIDNISNNINSIGEKIDKQSKHCERISNTVEEFRLCLKGGT